MEEQFFCVFTIPHIGQISMSFGYWLIFQAIFVICWFGMIYGAFKLFGMIFK